MKVSKHIEYLLRQGKKPKELLALGFPKRVVTRVRRKLREEKAIQQTKAPRGGEAEGHPQPSLASEETGMSAQEKLVVLTTDLEELRSRVTDLEVLREKFEDIENSLDSTPALGLKDRFTCKCGASGFVALHIQCTKCGQESLWGWFPDD